MEYQQIYTWVNPTPIKISNITITPQKFPYAPSPVNLSPTATEATIVLIFS